jgi:hypothetical protein
VRQPPRTCLLPKMISSWVSGLRIFGDVGTWVSRLLVLRSADWTVASISLALATSDPFSVDSSCSRSLATWQGFKVHKIGRTSPTPAAPKHHRVLECSTATGEFLALLR